MPGTPHNEVELQDARYCALGSQALSGGRSKLEMVSWVLSVQATAVACARTLDAEASASR